MADSNCGNRGCNRTACRGRCCNRAKLMADRVTDTRTQRELLEGLRVSFDGDDEAIIRRSVSVRALDVALEDLSVVVTSTGLDNGTWMVDVTYVFRVRLEAFEDPDDDPDEVEGQVLFTQRYLLCGGREGVRTVSSGGFSDDGKPVATVQVSQPVLLNAALVGESVLVSIGLFSVVSLERRVQITAPVCRYGVSCDQIDDSDGDDSSRAAFQRMCFPEAQFFPCPGDRNCDR